ncbi:hypothetical protein H0H92_006704 [Tricholoma furcatifolium]|nr:hypothetical protein H0H92_006704 [Tricholoma furcatifolium]
MADQFQMVARVPYPSTVPKYLAVASEVATMDFLRSAGLPVPKVYGYSPDSNNAAGTEYIFMEFIEGTKLSDVWRSLSEQDVISVVRDLTQLQSRMTSISFPAGGSLYYTKDLENVARGPGVPLEDGRFCVGPDTRLSLWYRKRTQLDVPRGPYVTPEASLEAPALKELAYLEQFGQPLLPFRRERRPTYKYQKQLPSDHILNLHRYLRIAPSLVPTNPGLRQFCIRQFHYAALTDSAHTLRSRLFTHAGNPWQGEPLELKVALIEATRMWGALTRKDTPCPVVFDADDVRKTMEMNKLQTEADEGFEAYQSLLGVGSEGWVPTDHYEKAVALSKQFQEEALTYAVSESERMEIAEHWPWDDMDEEAYM